MSYSGDELIKMGQKASFLYFTKDVPLEESVKKIASKCNLNPEQVKRVCEAANKSTMIQIYKSDSDNCSEFKLAQATEVIGDLSKTAEVMAEISYDYLDEPPTYLMVETINNETEKIASDPWKLREQKMQLEKEAKLLDRKLQDANDKTFYEYYKYAGALDVLYNVVKQGLVKGIHKLTDLIAAAKAAIPGAGEIIERIFHGAQGIKQRLTADPGVPMNALEGMFSGTALLKGAEAVDEKYISKAMQSANNKVPMKIINGDNRVIAHLKVIIDAKKKIRDSDLDATDIRNKLSVVCTKLDKVNKKGK